MAAIAASRMWRSRVGSSILILDILRLKLQLGRDREYSDSVRGESADRPFDHS